MRPRASREPAEPEPWTPLFEDATSILRPVDAEPPPPPLEATVHVGTHDGDHIRIHASATVAGDPTLTISVRGVSWPGGATVVVDPRTWAPALREAGELLVRVADRFQSRVFGPVWGMTNQQGYFQPLAAVYPLLICRGRRGDWELEGFRRHRVSGSARPRRWVFTRWGR
jgi:hypothetical protein